VLARTFLKLGRLSILRLRLAVDAVRLDLPKQMYVVLLAELLFAVLSAAPLPEMAAFSSGTSPRDIGRLLFTKYIYPFEITSVLIIAALIGAIVLVKKREKG